MLLRVVLVRTEVSDESFVSMIRMKRFSELGTTIVISISQKTAFFIVTAVKT
jgi:hypothetical protein